MRHLSKFTSPLSRRTILVIVGAQVALVGIIGGAVFANALNVSAEEPSEISVTDNPEIVGEIVIATPRPSLVPIPVETSEPEPSGGMESEPRVLVPNQGPGNGCQLAMDEIARTVQGLSDLATAAGERMMNYNYEGLDGDEQQAIIDGFNAEMDGYSAQIDAYYASLGIDPFRGYGCGGDGLPSSN